MLSYFTLEKMQEMILKFVFIEDLVPQYHLLKKIRITIDHSFTLEKDGPYYSEYNGRPSLDPLVLFKMMFIGYF